MLTTEVTVKNLETNFLFNISLNWLETREAYFKNEIYNAKFNQKKNLDCCFQKGNESPLESLDLRQNISLA